MSENDPRSNLEATGSGMGGQMGRKGPPTPISQLIFSYCKYENLFQSRVGKKNYLSDLS
ncbi:hypothetical protein ACRRTK_006125 [Alexandromys fortis]